MSNDYRSRQERRQKQKANAKTKKDRASLVKKILLGLLLFIGAGLVAGTIAVFAIIQDAPTLKPAMLDTPFTTTFYDRNNDPIPTEFSETIERDKVDIKNVPEMMKQAVISIEDRRFYDHFGIDVRRIIGAAIDDIRKGRLAEGGSTITQQVVKRSILSPKKTFVRKIQEAWLAIQLEQHYTKDEILEMYLNKIYYGNGAYGLKTAAEVYFDTKDLSKLNLSQMALLAGLPNAPSAYDPYEHPKKAAERRNQVLEAMVETGAISEKQAQEAKAKPVTKLLAKKDEDSTPPYYGAFLEEVFKELKEQKIVTDLTQFKQGGLKIYTTVDPESQKKVYKLQHSDEIPYPDKNFDIGAALLDTKTGAIRAIGGGRDYTSFQSGTNRALDTSNIPGSNIKPILDYGPAIEFLKWPTVHPIVDEKYKYPGSDTVVGEWDGEYWGKMTIERALAWSRNVPAVKALVATTEEVGKDKVSGFVQGLGIPLKDSYYYSAALGTMNVSPLQMAGAYSAFGNKGVYHEPYAVRKVVFPNGKTVELHHEPEVAMHDYTAYMITDMLKAVVNKGTGQMADISGLPVAGKTGSTQIPDKTQEKYDISEDGYLDEWFTGYTPEFTLSVWTGYPSITDEDGNVQFIRFGEGIDATDLAKLYFKKLISDISSKDVEDWEMPDSVVKVAIEKDTRKLPSENTPE
ncbi:MAG TPA: PBP1A family penicillin-binding protein, partial [Bacillales bacterium]|nr:PBP1A family penicillin-binding protein [Bacillales bacterium]